MNRKCRKTKAGLILILSCVLLMSLYPAGAVSAQNTVVNTTETAFLQEVLEAMDNSVYEKTLEALKGGEQITQGTYSSAASGLQHMLVDFGCDIAIDGSAGPGTFGALNRVMQAFGKEETDKVDAALFEELLPLLLLAADKEGKYEDLLKGYYDEKDGDGKYLYLKGCAYYAAERYYKAMEAFADSNYGDYEERVEGCKQDWPSPGEIWRNSAVYGEDMHLVFEVYSYNEDRGMCFEVYTSDGTLASVLFLTGSGRVLTKLPGGSYRIKDASGDAWYGRKDAFGRDGHYEFLTFDEFVSDPYLTQLDSGYEWTITINVQTRTTTGTDVDTVSSDWENWVGES